MKKDIALNNQKAGKFKTYLFTIMITLFFLFSLHILNISLLDLITGFPSFIYFFIHKFLWPDFTNIALYIPSVIETILFAVIGTYISTLLSFFLGLMMSELTNPYEGLRGIARGFVSLLRNIPVLIWASLLVYAFGVGEIVGLLALILATLGFLSRSYADSMNELSLSSLEPLKASGANYLQVLWHGLIPNFMPSWIHWTLYSFEINIRASAILGMVGAGGIGVLVQTKIKLFQYHEACTIIIVIISIVLLTEFVTNRLRAKIR